MKFSGCAEQVAMIGHDDVSPHHPGARYLPRIPQQIVHGGICEGVLAAFCADGNENNNRRFESLAGRLMNWMLPAAFVHNLTLLEGRPPWRPKY